MNILDENDKSKVDDETLDELAKKYMADDYAFGHGIQSTDEPRLGDQRDMAGFFAPPEMLKYQTGDRVVRAAIEEYNDGYFEGDTYEAEWMRAEPEEPIKNRAERRVGRYTADEYAEINAVPAMELF